MLNQLRRVLYALKKIELDKDVCPNSNQLYQANVDRVSPQLETHNTIRPRSELVGVRSHRSILSELIWITGFVLFILTCYFWILSPPVAPPVSYHATTTGRNHK